MVIAAQEAAAAGNAADQEAQGLAEGLEQDLAAGDTEGSYECLEGASEEEPWEDKEVAVTQQPCWRGPCTILQDCKTVLVLPSLHPCWGVQSSRGAV